MIHFQPIGKEKRFMKRFERFSMYQFLLFPSNRQDVGGPSFAGKPNFSFGF